METADRHIHFTQIIRICMIIVLLIGCTACDPSSEELASKAEHFIQSRVKFYGVSTNISQTTNAYDLELVSISKMFGTFRAIYLVHANISNATKSSNITVCFNKEGDPTHVFSQVRTCP